MKYRPHVLTIATVLLGPITLNAQPGEPASGRGSAWFEGPPRPLIGGGPQTGTGAQVRWDGPPTPLLGARPVNSPYQSADSGLYYGVRADSGTIFNPDTPMTPAGAVCSPWVGDMFAGADCSGPVGRNGPVTHEVYLRTGPSILAGADGFGNHIDTGWTVQGGGRTLFFNRDRSAAMALDLGLGFTNNNGRRLANLMQVRAGSLKGGNPEDNSLLTVGVRALHRTSFNFGVGRDWWLNGPGTVGENTFGNWRFGVDVGGRYGTASVSFEPLNDINGSRRRQGVFHGVYLGSHVNWEFPVFTWLGVIGLRTEWSYTATNLIPFNDGDIRDVSILMLFGIRF